MKKIALILIAFSLLFSANVKSIKKEIKNNKKIIYKMNLKLSILAKAINKKQREINQINEKISNLNEQIKQLQNSLKNSNQKLNELMDLKKGYESKFEEIQNEIDDFLSTNYYLYNKTIDNINDLINEELTKKILKQYSKKISLMLKTQKKLKSNINDISNQIKSIINQQQALSNKKKELIQLKKQREKELKNLALQKKAYKRKLLSIIKKQQELQQKLKELAVIKTTSHKTPPPKFTYKSKKGAIPPVYGKIIKYFGNYIDPIYKFRVYNDSITIKPYQKNALVRAILPGRVVYIDPQKGIIVIKHKNYLFSIYANLSKISPILRKGSYVKKGQIIARVTDTLEFEITYKDRPINPLKIIRF